MFDTRNYRSGTHTFVERSTPDLVVQESVLNMLLIGPPYLIEEKERCMLGVARGLENEEELVFSATATYNSVVLTDVEDNEASRRLFEAFSILEGDVVLVATDAISDQTIESVDRANSTITMSAVSDVTEEAGTVTASHCNNTCRRRRKVLDSNISRWNT